MKLQLEKVQRPDYSHPWYRITKDDHFVDGSYNREEIERKFEEFKANPDLLNTKKEVLKCEEI